MAYILRYVYNFNYMIYKTEQPKQTFLNTRFEVAQFVENYDQYILLGLKYLRAQTSLY
jgi:hypothetical protein